MAWRCTKSFCSAICGVAAAGTCVGGCLATALVGTAVGTGGASLSLAGASISSHFSSK